MFSKGHVIKMVEKWSEGCWTHLIIFRRRLWIRERKGERGGVSPPREREGGSPHLSPGGEEGGGGGVVWTN